MKTTAKTKREQVEETLMARGLVEVARGDWEGGNVMVRLDIRGAEDTAWWNRMFNGTRIGETEVVSYDEVLRRFE